MAKDLLKRILDGTALGAGDLAAEGPNVAWHQIALEGKWAGHWMGPFSLDAQMFDQMVEHFEAKAIQTVVDYEHSSVFSDTAPASGWITALQRRGGSGGEMATLWAQVGWTDKAAAHIRANEYKYVSPTIAFNTRDRKSGELTGASLHSMALTNKPFLEELPEVRLNSMRAAFLEQRNTQELAMTPEQFKALCKTLGLPDTSTVDEVMAALTKINALGADRASLIAALKLDADADTATALTSIEALQAAAPAKEDKTELSELRAQVTALNLREHTRSAEMAVLEQQRLGKVGGKDSDNYKQALSFAMRDIEGFKAFMATAPAIVPADSIERPNVTPSGNTGMDEAAVRRYTAQWAGDKADEIIKSGREAGVIK